MKKKSGQQLFTKDFTIMEIGQCISLFGNTLQRFALSLYILDITGSAAIFSILLSLTVIPQVILSPFGGAIADRFNKRNMMVVLDTISAILLTGFAVIVSKSPFSIINIGILMFILSMIQSIYDPAVRASLPIIVEQDNLTKANSIVTSISALTNLAGPIAAGFLYGIYGIEIIFIINVISFTISAIMEIFLVIPHEKIAIKGFPIKVFVIDIKESLSYLIHEKKIIFYMLILASGINLFLTPTFTVGVPYVEKIIFGVSDELYGISEGIIGFGMICGALLATVVSKKVPIGQLHRLFILAALCIIGMGVTTLPAALDLQDSNMFIYSCFTLIGFISSVIIININIISFTFMQIETPSHMMGKVMALVTSVSAALIPVGQVIYGVLYERLTQYIFAVYLITSVITVILIGVLARSEVYRKLSKQE
ncbi:MAG: MFS transporter [Clostridium sp.]|nr:MFS transporter [Clostridium sp.]